MLVRPGLILIFQTSYLSLKYQFAFSVIGINNLQGETG